MHQRIVDVRDKTLIQSGRTRLGKLSVVSGDNAIRFVQIFDAAAIADVTLGTTQPKRQITLAANAAPDTVREVDLSDGLFFLGVVMAITTLPIGSTPATNAMYVNVQVDRW